MSKKDEALKLALEALEEVNKLSIGKNAICLPAEIDTAMDAIREALAEQQQEPVAWKDRTYGNLHRQDFGNSIPIYTSPPASKPWVWLSSEEEKQIKDNCTTVVCVLKSVKAKLREKNT